MGGDTYHFGVAKIIIHLSHLLTGSWLVYIGYKKIIDEENIKLSGRVVTKLSELKNYCTAEEYHQKYLDKR